MIPSLKLTAVLHLKNGWLEYDWPSFWGKRPSFRGELLVSGSDTVDGGNPGTTRYVKDLGITGMNHLLTGITGDGFLPSAVLWIRIFSPTRLPTSSGFDIFFIFIPWGNDLI